MRVYTSMPLDERFWSKVIPEPNTGCWLWMAGLNGRGYGQLCAGDRKKGNRRVISAHRLSWELTFGEVPEGLQVLHQCDTRPCVNPQHLFLGTHQDNMADKVHKLRQCRGERHGSALLTKLEVDAIRQLREVGRPITKIARCFDISKSTVRSIVSGKAWRHV